MGTILKHFEDVLEECIIAIQERGEAVDDCLARYQEQITIDELFFGEYICYKSGPSMS